VGLSAHAQVVRTPRTHAAPELERGIAAASQLKICDAHTRESIASLYQELSREFHSRALTGSAASSRLVELQSSLRAALSGRDRATCVRDGGLREQDVCMMLAASPTHFVRKAEKLGSGDAVLHHDRIVMNSASNPKLEYVRTRNPRTGDYSSIVWLVDRELQKVVGSLDDRSLNLQTYQTNAEIRDYRGHELVTTSPDFSNTRFEYATTKLRSPLGLSDDCASWPSKIDNFLAEASRSHAGVRQWNIDRASLSPAEERELERNAGREGDDVGSTNLYESGKALVDGMKFFWDYGRNAPTDDPFEEGSKIGFRDLIHQSLGQMGREAFEACLAEICPNVKDPSPASCPLAVPRANACLSAKIARHVGKEVSDYVMACLTGAARPELGIGAGSESVSACLADVAVVTASVIPVAGAAKGFSVGGQAGYRAMLEATKNLSPGARSFLRTWTKRSIRGAAGTTLASVDLTLNQLPTSPADLKHLEKFFRSFLEKSALDPAHRMHAEEMLARVKEARRTPDATANPDLSREHLTKELERAYSGSDSKWYHENLEQDLDQALVERANFQRYLDEGLKPGEQVYWVQQRELKELNEKLWDIGGTEYYLMTLDRELGAFLKDNPNLGRIVHRNYKDRVVVSSLSAADFEKRVMAPLRARVSKEVSQVKERLGTSYLWNDYLEDSLKVGQGRDLEAAFMDLHLSARGQDFDTWKTQTENARQHLVQQVQSARPGVAFEKYLRLTRQLKSQPAKLAQALAKDGLPASLAPELIKYLDDLRVADFLPLAKPVSEADQRVLEHTQRALKNDSANPIAELPRIESIVDDSWIFQRSRFLKEAQGARYMVASDIRGLGEKALIAQDQWLASGASPQTLSRVYEGTTAFLNGRYAEVLGGLRKILGPQATIGVYRSGDDALWALPDMTIDQKNAVDSFFKEQGDMYHAVVDVNSQAGAAGVADAVHGAREKLFGDKAALKHGHDPPEAGPEEALTP